MLCDDVKKYFCEYVDNECSPAIRELVEAHVAECPDCQRELALQRDFATAVADLPMAELPGDFSAALADRLAAEKLHINKQVKPLYRRAWVRVLAGCACLLLVFGLVSALSGGGLKSDFSMMAADTPMAAPAAAGFAASSAANDVYFAKEEAAAEEAGFADEPAAEEAMVAGDGGELGSAADAALERKIIRNYSVNIKVEDFDAAYTDIQSIAAQYGGYVVSGNSYQDSYSSYRDGYLSIRVDAAQVEAAVAAIGALGTVENSSFSSDDVTAEYYDIAARLEQYQTQEQRLLSLYDQAGTIADLIEVETELTRVQSEIESMQGQIRYYDQLTALSLIDVYLYAPAVYSQTVEPQGWAAFGQDIRAGFLNGVNSLLDFLAALVVWVASNIIVLLVLAAVVILAVRLVKRRHRR